MTNLLERIKALESTLYYAGITVRTPITQADLDEYVMSRLEGFKVVPIEPTQKMLNSMSMWTLSHYLEFSAFDTTPSAYIPMYKAMLEAAPEFKLKDSKE